MSLFKPSFVLLFALMLNGCGYIYGEKGLIKSQKYDYVNAKQDKTLQIPEDLSHKHISDFALLPKIGEKAQKDAFGKELGQNAPIQLLAVLDNTRVDRQSRIPSVLIVERVEFIWQTIIEFLKKHDLATSIQDTENKLIITGWIPIEEGGIWLGLDGSEDIDLIRAKYKITLTDGFLKGEQKLQVERIKSQYREDDDEAWQEKRITWQESADMMNMLLSNYDTQLRIRVARHQQQIMAGFKVELGQDSNKSPALLTTAKEQLVWEKIPKVMSELGFTIIDKDIRQKTYFMEYHAPEQGFFASLFNDDEETKLPIEEGAFQVTVGENGNRRSIILKDGQGVALEANVLVKLYPELGRLFGDRR